MITHVEEKNKKTERALKLLPEVCESSVEGIEKIWIA